VNGPALRAEWTKLGTTPAPAWLLAAVVVCTVVVSTVAVSAVGAAIAAGPCPGCGVDPTRLGLVGIQLGQAVVAVLAVLCMGGEYGTGLIHVTLAAIPRRSTVLAAKATVLAAVVAGAATLAVAGSLLVARMVLSGHGIPVALGDAAVLRAAAGSVLYLVLIAGLGLGVATAVRDSATAMGIVLALLYAYPIVIRVVSDPVWLRRLERLGPTTAGLAVQATTGLDRLHIGPWPGLGVLALWAGLALTVGAVVLHRRDA
jgi:ABC-2 type transport system permease protein